VTDRRIVEIDDADEDGDAGGSLGDALRCGLRRLCAFRGRSVVPAGNTRQRPQERPQRRRSRP
jgi:hypothetical protein